MGTCEYCGTRYPKTRSTRKYCTPRCKTNACLDRRPRRIRAAAVEALHALLQAEVTSAEMFRERLREIIAPNMAPFAVNVPTMD